MEVKEQNEKRLVFETDFVLYIFRPENILIVIAFVIFFIGSIPSGPTFRIPFWWIFVFIAIFVWAIVNNEIIFDCTIDKESEVILAKVRAAWRLGIPRITKISFHEVNNLVLKKRGNGIRNFTYNLNPNQFHLLVKVPHNLQKKLAISWKCRSTSSSNQNA